MVSRMNYFHRVSEQEIEKQISNMRNILRLFFLCMSEQRITKEPMSLSNSVLSNKIAANLNIFILFLFYTDIDECNSSIPVCDVNAKCENTNGSYNCSCKTGFIGDGKRCQGKQDESVTSTEQNTFLF